MSDNPPALLSIARAQEDRSKLVDTTKNALHVYVTNGAEKPLPVAVVAEPGLGFEYVTLEFRSLIQKQDGNEHFYCYLTGQFVSNTFKEFSKFFPDYTPPLPDALPTGGRRFQSVIDRNLGPNFSTEARRPIRDKFYEIFVRKIYDITTSGWRIASTKPSGFIHSPVDDFELWKIATTPLPAGKASIGSDPYYITFERRTR